MNREGILKVQLFNLEKSAETLERIVHSDLTALDSLPDAQAEAHEPRVLRKLEKLDELQDEIDAVIAELKTAGWHESRTAGQNVYEYKPPKVKVPGVASAPTGKRAYNRKAPVKSRQKVDPRTSERWKAAQEFMAAGDGIISLSDLVKLTGISGPTGSRHLKEWTEAGMLRITQRRSHTKCYALATI